MKTIMAALLMLLLSPSLFFSADPARIYIANDDHTDYMWSGNEADYSRAFCNMIEYYLDRADATQDQPADFQARFNCDGSLWMWEYERNNPANFARLISRIKDGHISVPLTPLTVCYGAQSVEGILRGMYYAGRIERRYHLRFITAQPMEDQTMPYGLGSLFAGAGARYCWMGICNCATRVPDNTSPRLHEIYWWQGRDKSRKVLIKWNSMLAPGGIQDRNMSLGGYAEARYPDRIVDFMLGNSTYKSLWPYPLIRAAFGKGWDDLETETTQFEDVSRQKSSPGLHVRNSNEIDFFQDFERTYAQDPSFPHYSAAFGNEWDLYPASASEITARVKRSIEKLRNAEAMATLVSLKNPKFMNGRETERDLAFMNMGLYFNHDWTADRNVVWKDALGHWARRLAGQVESYVDKLQSEASFALGNLIQKSDQNTRFYVFNPLSWERTDVADFPYSEPAPLQVIDLATGQETPSQIVTVGSHQQYVRVLAQKVPSVGFKVFEIRPGQGHPFVDSISANAGKGSLSNEFYSLLVGANGAITSLVEKSSQRQFVKEVNGRAVNDLGPGNGTMEVENAGIVSATLKIKNVPSPLMHTTRVTLYRNSGRIDIRNEITQNFGSVGDNPPAWAFSFNLSPPDIWHEEVGDIIHARLQPDGHYSSHHARYDWLTLNHFADMSAGGTGVTLAKADCLFMKTGSSTLTSLDVTTPQINVLVGGQIDGPNLGVYNQGGDGYFLQRFALRTHGAYDQTEAMKFGLEHQNPLVAGPVTGSSTSYSENSHSLLTVSDPNVLLWALKPSEDGILNAGIALRVWNMSDSTSNPTVRLTGWDIHSSQHATHVETVTDEVPVADSSLIITVPGNAIETYLIRVRNPG
ncbi:MAG TPA: glycoside hydrolase [Terriglobia bacterium]|nr:glycoside hydrolase [Terriglobia bacterium]